MLHVHAQRGMLSTCCAFDAGVLGGRLVESVCLLDSIYCTASETQWTDGAPTTVHKGYQNLIRTRGGGGGGRLLNSRSNSDATSTCAKQTQRAQVCMIQWREVLALQSSFRLDQLAESPVHHVWHHKLTSKFTSLQTHVVSASIAPLPPPNDYRNFACALAICLAMRLCPPLPPLACLATSSCSARIAGRYLGRRHAGTQVSHSVQPARAHTQTHIDDNDGC